MQIQIITIQPENELYVQTTKKQNKAINVKIFTRLAILKVILMLVIIYSDKNGNTITVNAYSSYCDDMGKHTNIVQYVSFRNISSQKLLKFIKNVHSSSAVFGETFTASEAIFTGINLGSKNSPFPRHTLQPRSSSPHHSPVIPPWRLVVIKHFSPPRSLFLRLPWPRTLSMSMCYYAAFFHPLVSHKYELQNFGFFYRDPHKNSQRQDLQVNTVLKDSYSFF